MRNVTINLTTISNRKVYLQVLSILGDSGADSGGEGKSKRAEK